MRATTSVQAQEEDAELAALMNEGRWRAWSALTVILAAQAAVSSWWMWAHGFLGRPPTSDAAWYRLDALALLSGFKDGWLGFAAAVLGTIAGILRPCPPSRR
jgi:hypothetical protein